MVTVQLVPERFTKTYVNWLRKHPRLDDFSSIMVGHRIPAWYCAMTVVKRLLAVKTLQNVPHCHGHVTQDPGCARYMWFSSGLWPFATMGWPKRYSRA